MSWLHEIYTFNTPLIEFSWLLEWLVYHEKVTPVLYHGQDIPCICYLDNFPTLTTWLKYVIN